MHTCMNVELYIIFSYGLCFGQWNKSNTYSSPQIQNTTVILMFIMLHNEYYVLFFFTVFPLAG